LAPSLTLRQALVEAAWRDRSLLTINQAGLVNNLNDGLAWAPADPVRRGGPQRDRDRTVGRTSTRRASAVGVYRLWRDSGYAIGALIASIIADVVGLRGAILTVAALTAASGLIAARLLTETNITGETTMARSKVNHPLFARFYAWVSPRMEKVGYGERRGQLLAGLTGRVLEVGAGNGLNFAHYPPEVTGVLAVEPEPHLRALAETRASETAIPIEVVDGTADQLPEADASFDAVVASLVLCSVPDVPAALTEIRRVVKPGGELRFFEHVRADTPGLARVQRVLDATVWPTFGGGCHAHRDTRTAIEAAGFTITGLEQLRIPETGIPGPTSPHIIGAATTKEG
jgi:ubiquinone/menaquinone biosynthesis C-methylase UbiE